MKKLLAIVILASLTGCGHAISQEIRAKALKDIPVGYALKHPENFIGNFIILGGVIVSSKNTPAGTYIEVVEKQLDSQGRPEDTDISRGRFIILSEQYLDTAIYTRGREITVAGEVMGRMPGTIDEVQYSYLLIKGRELYLFKERRDLPIHFGIGIWHSF